MVQPIDWGSGRPRSRRGWRSSGFAAPSPRFRCLCDDLRLNIDRGTQLKLQPGLGRELQMFLAARRHERAAAAADRAADRRPFSAAGNAANDGSEAGTAADFPPGLLAFAFA